MRDVTKKSLWVGALALVAEVFAVRWRWVSAPTDGLRVWYEGSFGTYFADCITPWLVAFGVLITLWLLVTRIVSKKRL